jgi:hypothetical protein
MQVRTLNRLNRPQDADLEDRHAWSSLGLGAVVEGTPYEVAAESLRPCQVAFIRRDNFCGSLRGRRVCQGTCVSGHCQAVELEL